MYDGRKFMMEATVSSVNTTIIIDLHFMNVHSTSILKFMLCNKKLRFFLDIFGFIIKPHQKPLQIFI